MSTDLQRQNHERPRPGVIAATGAMLSSVGVIALLTRLIDTFTVNSESADRLTVIGIATLLIGVGMLVAGRGHAHARRLAVLSLGLSPFTIFALFLVWRIGLSGEQLAACEDDNDALACRTLAERRAKRNKMDDAQYLYRRGCELGDARSCTELAGLLRRGDEVGSAEHLRDGEALSLYQRACELGEAMGCDNAGRMLRSTDAEEALRWYERGCNLAYPASCSALERAVQQGEDAAQSAPRGELPESGHTPN